MRSPSHANIELAKYRLLVLKAGLNERQSRILYGFLATEIGFGGQKAVSEAMGVSHMTVRKGQSEFEGAVEDATAVGADEVMRGRIRRPGGGRKSAVEKQPGLLQELEELLNPATFGDPQRVIVWTTLSLRKISELLASKGFIVSHTVVGQLLEELGYSKQVNQKMLQVSEPHPDRDEQFKFINAKSKTFLENGDPVISIDCKKKENIGNFKNNGAEYRPKGTPRHVLDHDFQLADLGKVAPYGVYVVNDNTAFVNLGTSSDTAEFAGESIWRWWDCVGSQVFGTRRKLFITCDGGGSNGCRIRLWKVALARLAEQTGLEIHVSHLPPGTSKWNKIEHRLFCYISKNWQGQPLVDIETVVKLISSTTTKRGLKVDCVVDQNTYERGLAVSDEAFAAIDLEPIAPFGQWNYIIRGFKSESE